MLWTKLCTPHPPLPRNLYVEAVILGDGDYKEAIKIKLGFKGGVLT